MKHFCLLPHRLAAVFRDASILQVPEYLTCSFTIVVFPPRSCKIPLTL